MMQIFLCCLFGLLFIQVSAVPPENCQEDYDPVCRTDFRYRLSHDWIPYANASSGDGIRWRVLVDQHDYQNIFGSQNVPPGVWKEVDVDGDGLNWIHGSGGTCTYQIRVSSFRRPSANNWYFTQALSYCDAVELIVNTSVRFSACTQRPDCIHDYVYLHRFDTNSPNEVDRIKYENYQYIISENETASQLKQIGFTSDTQIIKYFQRPATSHTYFGIQDVGTNGQVQRFMVYYKVCQKNHVGLTIYPEVPLPPHTAGANDRIIRVAQCVAHAHNVTSLETYAYRDHCEQNVVCECDPGYERSSTSCIPCGKGYYKSSLNSSCVLCPMNTKGDKEAADLCECSDGYYRAPNEGVGMMCTAPPSRIPNKLRVVSMCDTSALLEWDKPEDVGRDDFYYGINRTSPDADEEIMLNKRYIDDKDFIRFRVTGLRPTTTYTFSVCVHNGVSQFDQVNDKLRLVSQQATTRQGSTFMHNNMALPNNSVVLREEIGQGEEALICQTLTDAQCGSGASPAFFSPDEAKILPAEYGQTLYSTNATGQVRLNRKPGDESPLGSYCCQIPDSEGNIQKMFIKIATFKECKRGMCPGLEDPANGNVRVFGYEAFYSCNDNYKLVGSSIRICGNDGQWSMETAPECIPIPTTPLPPATLQPTTKPSSGDLEFELKGKAYTNGSKVSLNDIGEGDNALICRTSRSDCCDGGNRRGEFLYPNGSPVGIQIKNEPMYRNRGPQLIRLNRNSGSAPTGWYRCEIPDVNNRLQSILINIEASSGVVCPQPGDPAGGSVTVNVDTPIPGSTARYTCDVDRLISGRSIRVCQENGTWSQIEPTCELINCPTLSNPDNGKIVQFGNSVNSTASYTCDSDFELSGESQRTCGRDGQWTGKAPLCKATVNLCPFLEHPANGLVTVEDRSPESVATYSCNGGYSLKGSATRLCQSNGTWTNEPPMCVSVGFQLNGQFYASGSSLSLSSIGEGDSALQCVTDANCCSPPNRAGEFYFPNGNLVLTQGSGADIYRNRGEGMIRLNRRNNATSPTGNFTCKIPDSSGSMCEIYVTLN